MNIDEIENISLLSRIYIYIYIENLFFLFFFFVFFSFFWWNNVMIILLDVLIERLLGKTYNTIF